MGEKTDQRKNPRYAISSGKALFVFNHFSTRVGCIKDISQGGLSFEYIHKSGRECIPEVIDIFSNSDELFFMPTVPCRKIYDTATVGETEPFSGLETRRCGLQYGPLTREQEKQIAELLKSRLIEPRQQFRDKGG